MALRAHAAAYRADADAVRIDPFLTAEQRERELVHFAILERDYLAMADRSADDARAQRGTEWAAVSAEECERDPSAARLGG